MRMNSKNRDFKSCLTARSREREEERERLILAFIEISIKIG